MLPDPQTRLQILEIFFCIYIDVFGKYGDIVATSEDLGALAYIYYEERSGKRLTFIKDMGCAFLKAMDLLKYMKMQEVKKFLKTLKVMSSEWIYDQIEGQYIHLDLIVVKEEARGKGKAKQIIGYIINEATEKGLPLTLETQNPDNVALYEHFGFEVVHTISWEGMTQYCMIRK
ncbi:MAG: GNAT family N-acetyltransferase [Cellulosilyticaceae bacterium]